MSQRITIGFATILGTIGAAAGVLIPLLGQLADAAEPLGVSPQVWVTAGAVLASVVVVGRMAQAIAASITGAPADTEPAFLIDEAPVEPTDIASE